jgi:hypothetical protein
VAEAVVAKMTGRRTGRSALNFITGVLLKPKHVSRKLFLFKVKPALDAALAPQNFKTDA